VDGEGLDILTKLFPLINATALITLIGIALKYRLAARKADLEEGEFDRKGWRELIETLNAQVSQLSRQVSDLTNENSQLRTEVRELHGALEGIRRQNLQEGSSAANAILSAIPPENIPPATRDALRRVRGDK
jgi:peptidoglycan hydrolase CwlO-like protein